MTPIRSLAILFVLSSLSLTAPASQAEESAASPVTVYPASFFDNTQPSSAFDMLAVLPGYDFSESDTDVRGFAGAVGNVLIDLLASRNHSRPSCAAFQRPPSSGSR
jgi:hypothetical protein